MPLHKHIPFAISLEGVVLVVGTTACEARVFNTAVGPRKPISSEINCSLYYLLYLKATTTTVQL